jgi:hypothetical protein
MRSLWPVVLQLDAAMSISLLSGDCGGGLMHRLAARWVWFRTGFTHWSGGPSNYTYDPSYPLCRLRALWRRTE